MAPSCALDETGLRLQSERYRQAGKGAVLVDRNPRRLIVELDHRVDASTASSSAARSM
jgi:hypothetical protein